MRADRLLALLMLLQTRGRMTAAQLSAELEVSERTIYRDIVALSTAGVPVYTDRGPGGGVELLHGYRSTLTGLTEQEVQALFMLNTPAALDALGVGPALRTALLKLAAALPAERQGDETRARRRVHLDSTPWQPDEAPGPHLPALQQAVWQDRRLDLVYRSRFEAQIALRVDPYGLAAKVNDWHLVYAREGQVRALRVSSILRVVPLAETFERPPDFDLAGFWKKWCADNQANRSRYAARVRIAAELVPHLSHLFGEDVRRQAAEFGPPDAQGRITLDLIFDDFQAARARLLSLGRAAEALAPRALRLSVLDYARQVIDGYGEV